MAMSKNDDEHHNTTSANELVNDGRHHKNPEPDTITSNNRLETETELENDGDVSQEIVNEEEQPSEDEHSDADHSINTGKSEIDDKDIRVKISDHMEHDQASEDNSTERH